MKKNFTIVTTFASDSPLTGLILSSSFNTVLGIGLKFGSFVQHFSISFKENSQIKSKKKHGFMIDITWLNKHMLIDINFASTSNKNFFILNCINILILQRFDYIQIIATIQNLHWILCDPENLISDEIVRKLNWQVD